MPKREAGCYPTPGAVFPGYRGTVLEQVAVPGKMLTLCFWALLPAVTALAVRAHAGCAGRVVSGVGIPSALTVRAWGCIFGLALGTRIRAGA